jgi:hypothetical protein
MAAIEVEILSALRVVDIAAGASHRLYIIK